MLKFILSAKTSVKLLGVAILLIFLHYVGIIRPIENLAIRILSPIQHQVYSVGSSFNNFYSGFGEKKEYKEDNDRLNEEVKNLTIENSQLRTLVKNEAEIDIQERFLQSTGLTAVPARVIGKNPEANLQAIIIDRGARHGISLDQAVITSEGVIVGKIYKVREHSSEAILVNDPKSNIAAIIQNEAESKGIVKGEHGISLKMELIPQNEKVTEGDVVVTSGIEPTIARGLIIGKVTRVETYPNEIFQTAFLQSLVRIDNLTSVSVLATPDYEDNL